MKSKILEFIKNIKINERTINYVLILVLGFLVGVAVKTEAKNRITIGYGDYLVNGMKQDFDLNKTIAPAPPAQGQAPAQPSSPQEQAPSPDNTTNQ